MSAPITSHNDLPFYASTAFAVMVAVLIFVMFIVACVVLLFVLPLSGEGRTAALAAVTGFAAPVLGVLVLLLRQQFNTELLNGHLAVHVAEAAATGNATNNTGTAAP